MNKVRKNVTTSQLETILNNLPNSIGTFAKLVQVTEPNLTVKDRQTKEPRKFNKVQKLTALTALLNTEYVNGVKNQLCKEGKCDEEYKQGKNTMPLVLSDNNNFFGHFRGQAVIQYRPFDNSFPTSKYIADGKLTDKENLGDILPKRRKATNQGTDKEIQWRKLYVKNIKRITINKVEYVVKN